MCLSQSCHSCCPSSQRTAIQTFLFDETCCSKVEKKAADVNGKTTVFDLISAFQINNTIISISVCPESAPLTIVLTTTTTTSSSPLRVTINPGNCLTLSSTLAKKLELENASTTKEGSATISFRIHYDYTLTCGC